MSTALQRLHVMVLEDHELLAHSLSLALQAASMRVDVLALESLDHVVTEVATHRPHVVLLDLQLGGRIGDGDALVRPLADLGARVLVVTAVTQRHRLAATVEAGAVGFVSKSQPLDRLVQAVHSVARGEHLFGEDVRQQLMVDLRRHRAQQWTRESVFHRLTRREQQVLGALCDGKTVEHIAREWTVSVATVRSQVRAVLTKLDVSSQLTAVALARKSGWSAPT